MFEKVELTGQRWLSLFHLKKQSSSQEYNFTLKAQENKQAIDNQKFT